MVQEFKFLIGRVLFYGSVSSSEFSQCWFIYCLLPVISSSQMKCAKILITIGLLSIECGERSRGADKIHKEEKQFLFPALGDVLILNFSAVPYIYHSSLNSRCFHFKDALLIYILLENKNNIACYFCKYAIACIPDLRAIKIQNMVIAGLEATEKWLVRNYSVRYLLF